MLCQRDPGAREGELHELKTSEPAERSRGDALPARRLVTREPPLLKFDLPGLSHARVPIPDDRKGPRGAPVGPLSLSPVVGVQWGRYRGEGAALVERLRPLYEVLVVKQWP